MVTNNNKEIIRLEKKDKKLLNDRLEIKYKKLLNDPNISASAGTAEILSHIQEKKKQISNCTIAGRVRAEQRATEAFEHKIIIHEEASKLLEQGKEKKDIAGIIIKRKKYSSSKVYRALKSHPSKKWNK